MTISACISCQSSNSYAAAARKQQLNWQHTDIQQQLENKRAHEEQPALRLDPLRPLDIIV